MFCFSLLIKNIKFCCIERIVTWAHSQPEREAKKVFPIQKQFMIDIAAKRKPMNDVLYVMKLFCQYLTETDIDMNYLSAKQAQDFQSWIMTLTKKDGSVRYAKATASNVITTMKSFYNYLFEKGRVYANPFKLVKRVTQGKTLPKDIHDEESVCKILGCLKEFWKCKDPGERKDSYRTHVIAELMYSTGLTIGEVKRLVPADIDFTRNVVKIKDGFRGVDRECILNEFAAKVLAIYVEKMRRYLYASPNYNKGRHLLFCSGTQLKKFVNANMRKAAKRMKLKPFTTKDFKHSLALHLVKAGCDARYVQEIVGHARLNTTQLYVRIEKKELRDVIDAYHPRRFEGRR
jgi:integrase/recombinase XerD